MKGNLRMFFEHCSQQPLLLTYFKCRTLSLRGTCRKPQKRFTNNFTHSNPFQYRAVHSIGISSLPGPLPRVSRSLGASPISHLGIARRRGRGDSLGSDQAPSRESEHRPGVENGRGWVELEKGFGPGPNGVPHMSQKEFDCLNSQAAKKKHV